MECKSVIQCKHRLGDVKIMIYLKTFKLSDSRITNNNIYPFNILKNKEPEVSLSPQNQVKLAEEINKMARYLGVQFIIATHSPFMLGILNAKIYNLDTQDYKIQKWNELENVRYFYDFFKSRKNEFEK